MVIYIGTNKAILGVLEQVIRWYWSTRVIRFPLCHGTKSLGSFVRYCQVLDVTGGYTEPVSAILSQSRLHSGLGYARVQVQLYSVEGILIYLLYTLFDL